MNLHETIFEDQLLNPIRNSLFFLVILALNIPIHADGADPSSSYQATTASDPKISRDRLQVLLRPLTPSELEIELHAWLELLKTKTRQIGETELELKDAEVKQRASGSLPVGKDSPAVKVLKDQLGKQFSEQSAVADRVRAVTGNLKEKGGDVAAPELLVNSMTGMGGVTDVSSLRARTIGWLKSSEGGQVLAKRIAMALGIFIVFWVASKYAGRAAERALSRQQRVSNLFKNFVRRMAGAVVFAIGIVMALGALGINIGPLLAAMGAGGFILAFALQETLGNFASGMLIMVYQPFDVDDYVEIGGVSGKVKQMSLVSTTLLTADNKVLIIPNKLAWGDTITNYNGENTRRVDLLFGIGYQDDIPKAIDVLRELAAAHELVLEEPEVNVKVHQLADSAVNLICRPWVKTEDYWTVYWDLTRQAKEQFDAEGISIPYPQRDVHMHQVATS